MHTPKSDAEEIEETGRDGRNEDEGDDRRELGSKIEAKGIYGWQEKEGKKKKKEGVTN
jgi:hypothetical protein